MQAEGSTTHEYRLRLGEHGQREVRASVDRQARRIALELPNGACMRLDAVTARAVLMVLHEAVYTSLVPAGPSPRVERGTDHGCVREGRVR